MRILLAAIAVVIAFIAGTSGQVSATFVKWTPGTLDIHQINTGRGNSSFLMLPDGTTMLIDAGDGGARPPRATPPKPDGSRTPADWIVRYVRAMGGSRIDYGYLTHFHDDHMGAMPGVARSIAIGTMLDRAWPDYNYPSAAHDEFTRADFVEYRELLMKGQMKGERLRPGRDDQIVLRHERPKYTSSV